MYLKKRLAAGESAIGVQIASGSPAVVEHAAVGMDWIWWECQHMHADWQTTAHAMRAASAIGVAPLIRSWTRNGETIERLLDTGAEGIILPVVDTADQARDIVSHCYYPPIGIRSLGGVRALRIDNPAEEWNKRIITVMMIESPEGVENAEEIARVPGVDALLMGMFDLALRMGLTLDNVLDGDPRLLEASQHVADVCHRSGKVAATQAVTPDSLKDRIRDGYRLICAGVDLDDLKRIYTRTKDLFRETTAENRGAAE